MNTPKERKKNRIKRDEQKTKSMHLPNENKDSLHFFCNWYYIVARGRDTGRSMAQCPKRIVRPSRICLYIMHVCVQMLCTLCIVQRVVHAWNDLFAETIHGIEF